MHNPFFDIGAVFKSFDNRQLSWAWGYDRVSDNTLILFVMTSRLPTGHLDTVRVPIAGNTRLAPIYVNWTPHTYIGNIRTPAHQMQYHKAVRCGKIINQKLLDDIPFRLQIISEMKLMACGYTDLLNDNLILPDGTL